MYKKLIVGLMTAIAVFIGGYSSAITLHVGSGPNFDWCTTNSGTIAVSYGECIGLAWLYQETNGNNWGQHDNWFSGPSFANWDGWNGNNNVSWQVFGVGAANLAGGHLHEIYLDNNNLSGTIMTGLLYFPYLTTLNLANSRLTFSNDALSQLTGLVSLGLSKSNLTGINLSGLASLQELTIDQNSLTYIDISPLVSLQTFNASNNQLTGINYGLLSGGKYLNISNNNLGGYLGLAGVTRLNYLSASGNGFTGVNLMNLTGTSEIYLQTNPISTLDLQPYNTYSGGLVAHLDGTSLPITGLPLNTYWWLHSYDSHWGWVGLDAGKKITLTYDVCPNGDSSPTQYDGLCSGMSASNNNLALSSTGTSNTGTISSTGSTYTNTTVTNTTVTENSTGEVFTPIGWRDMDMCPSSEMEDAYLYAHEHGITTMDTCKKARMNDTLTRADAAKMIVNYLMTVRKKPLPEGKTKCKFTDMADKNMETNSYAIAACEYGVMGLKGDGTPAQTFNPDGLLDKAQFATILSRIIYGSENNDTTCWYCKHVDALKADGVIKVTTDLTVALPRGYAMLMLMRMGN